MDKWRGGVAVVTGASSGIGHAVAIKLAEHGLKVAALARRYDKLLELASSFKGQGKIIPYKCDVTDQKGFGDVLKKLEKEHGRIRVLVNNAGVSHHDAFSDFNLDIWKKMFNLNVFGMFHGIKYVMEEIKKSDPGLVQIININSIAGQYKMDDLNLAPYQATKFSVTILTRALIQQIAKDKLNVKVTSLSPGAVKTDILNAGNWEGGDDLWNLFPHLQPEDVADAVISVLSFKPDVIISELTIKPKGETL